MCNNPQSHTYTNINRCGLMADTHSGILTTINHSCVQLARQLNLKSHLMGHLNSSATLSHGWEAGQGLGAVHSPRWQGPQWARACKCPQVVSRPLGTFREFRRYMYCSSQILHISSSILFSFCALMGLGSSLSSSR